MLTSGLWYGSSSDPWLNPVPVAVERVAGYATNYSSGERKLIWQPSLDTPILASESDPNLTYHYFTLAEDGTTLTMDQSDGIFYNPTTVPFRVGSTFISRGNEEYYQTFYSDYFNVTDGGSRLYRSPIGHHNLETHIYWKKRSGSLTVVPNGTDSSLQCRTPFFWQNKDLAELMWLFTTFYNNKGYYQSSARDMLDYNGLLRYSEINDSCSHKRINFEIWREHGKKIEEHIIELVQSAGAWMSFTCSGLNSAMEYKCTLVHPDDLQVSPLSIDLDNPKGLGILADPTMRFESEYVVNSVENRWGSFAVSDLSSDDTGDAMITTTLESPGSVGDGANIVKQSKQSSIDEIGEKKVSITSRFVQDPVMASARIKNSLRRFSATPRVIEITLGPLHYQWRVGEIVYITHTQYGVNNVPFILESKELSLWPMPSAKMTFVQYSETDVWIAPNHSSLSGNLLAYFTGQSGLVLDGIYVDKWYGTTNKDIPASEFYLTSSGINYRHYRRPVIGGIGGKDAVDFLDPAPTTPDLGDPDTLHGGPALVANRVDMFDTIPFASGLDDMIQRKSFTAIYVIERENDSDTQYLFSNRNTWWWTYSQPPGFMGHGIAAHRLFHEDPSPGNYVGLTSSNTGGQVVSFVMDKGVGECFAFNRLEIYDGLTNVETTDNKYTAETYTGVIYVRAGMHICHSGVEWSYPTVGNVARPENDLDWFITDPTNLKGQMAVFALYDRALLPHELESVVRYLGALYNIEV